MLIRPLLGALLCRRRHGVAYWKRGALPATPGLGGARSRGRCAQPVDGALGGILSGIVEILAIIPVAGS